MIVWCLSFALLFGVVSAGWIKGPEERVVNGIPVESHIPFQVALLRNGTQACGGAIYSERIILTAAHCVIGKQVDLSVRAGSSSWSKGGQLVDVIKVIIHEDANPEGINDIAVLLLSSPLKFDDLTQHIELAESTPCAGTPAGVSGWGSRNVSDKGPDKLHFVEVTVKDRKKCQQAYNLLAELLAEDKPIPVTEDIICASLYGDGACHGDSGGPLYTFEPLRLIGIVSKGYRCITPGHFTDVAFFKTWIESTVSRLNCCLESKPNLVIDQSNNNV